MSEQAKVTDLAEVKAKNAAPNSLARFFDQNRKKLEAILPEHITPNRIMRLSLNCIQDNDKLMQCTISSLFGAVLECASLGLEPGTRLGQAYLLPFYNKDLKGADGEKGGYEVQVIFGYPGLQDLATRDGRVKLITPRSIYENELFDIDYGYEFPLSYHKPAPPVFNDKGMRQIVLCYTVADLASDLRSFRMMWAGEIEEHRDKFCQANAYWEGRPRLSSPWWKTPEAMWWKTVIRQHCKYLPRNPHLNKALGLENDVDAGQTQDLDKWLDGEYTVVNDDPLPEAPPEPGLPEIPEKYLDQWTVIKDTFAGENGKREAVKAFADIPDPECKKALADHFNKLCKSK